MIWLTLIPFVLLAFFMQTAIHEFSHAAVARMVGYKSKVFPYPHFKDKKFYFGRIEISRPPGVPFAPDWVEGLEDFAPILVGLFQFFFFGTLWAVFGPTNIFVLDLFLTVLIAAGGIDGFRGLFLSFLPNYYTADINKALRWWDTSRFFFQIMFAVLLSVAIAMFGLFLVPPLF